MSVLQDIAREESKLEMTPMIDVTFLLLIFFMCTIKFKTLEGKLDAFLPKGQGVNPTEAPAVEAIQLEINLVKPGQRIQGAAYAANGQVIPYDGECEFHLLNHEVSYRLGRQTFPGTTAGLEDLLRELKSIQAAQPERPIQLKPTGEVVHGDVITVLDGLMLEGVTDVTIVGAQAR